MCSPQQGYSTCMYYVSEYGGNYESFLLDMLMILEMWMVPSFKETPSTDLRSFVSVLPRLTDRKSYHVLSVPNHPLRLRVQGADANASLCGSWSLVWDRSDLSTLLVLRYWDWDFLRCEYVLFFFPEKIQWLLLTYKSEGWWRQITRSGARSWLVSWTQLRKSSKQGKRRPRCLFFGWISRTASTLDHCGRGAPKAPEVDAARASRAGRFGTGAEGGEGYSSGRIAGGWSWMAEYRTSRNYFYSVILHPFRVMRSSRFSQVSQGLGFTRLKRSRGIAEVGMANCCVLMLRSECRWAWLGKRAACMTVPDCPLLKARTAVTFKVSWLNEAHLCNWRFAIVCDAWLCQFLLKARESAGRWELWILQKTRDSLWKAQFVFFCKLSAIILDHTQGLWCLCCMVWNMNLSKRS